MLELRCCCLVFILQLFSFHSSLGQIPVHKLQCYNSKGEAQRCMPEFINAAFGKLVVSNNTCGTPPSTYCVQTGVTGVTEECHVCDASKPSLDHPSILITDIKDDKDQTWWQSDTLLDNNKPVTLNLDLGKSFDVTYIRIRFRSPRPESMAIYKKSTANPNSPWIPYQYFSASCTNTYNLPSNGIIYPQDQQVALCTDKFSQIVPLTGGNVAFSTLEGRPDAYNFDSSPELQEWVTASSIRIDLDRINSFGDEVFGDPNVLRSYYFAIIDLAIGGRCKCNGHASECVRRILQTDQQRVECRCEHNTTGIDCGECLPMYNDQKWARATSKNANPCVKCNCNNLADGCVYDDGLYRSTGHGGRCIDCKNNTGGINCERCKENYYRTDENDLCKPCDCNPTGSGSLQCDRNGRCPCKPGVMGDKCDRCRPNYYRFGESGCQPCKCDSAGTNPNNMQCDDQGQCNCKRNVIGVNCDECRPGFFDLDAGNIYGCRQCFCYGHSSDCKAARGFGATNITSEFTRGFEGWTVTDAQGNDLTSSIAVWEPNAQNVRVTANGERSLFINSPGAFRGNIRSSYSRLFGFKFRLGTQSPPQIGQSDITIEGPDGLKLTAPLIAQGNPYPTTYFQKYIYRLHHDARYGWKPQMSAYDFQRVLTDVRSLVIRMTYSDQGTGMIDDVFLEAAEYSPSSSSYVDWVEQCFCPPQYSGLYCQLCQDGYKRVDVSGGPYVRCEACECHGHADSCDPRTGKCFCKDNTAGPTCDVCADGYYGNPTMGNSDDCKACPCVFGTRCVEISGDVVCTDCPEGHTGMRCEQCKDGWFGDPQGLQGPATQCQRCQCSGNIDINSVGNCDPLTGKCLKCIHNTMNGPLEQCEDCAVGYYGDAVTDPRGQCKACNCFPNGTVLPSDHDPSLPLPCDDNGQCTCRPNVVGNDCSSCIPNYWNVGSGQGCETCDCNVIGSLGTQCDIYSGQCPCKPGIVGRKCDMCAPDYYRFSEEGCLACNCSAEGSLEYSCNDDGVCVCREGVMGIKCNRCEENKYNLTAGCIRCPPCFDQLKNDVDSLRKKVDELANLVANFGKDKPSEAVNDKDFERRLKTLTDEINKLSKEAENSQIKDRKIEKQLQTLNDSLVQINKELMKTSDHIDNADGMSTGASTDVTDSEDSIERSKELLKNAKSNLMTSGMDALHDAETAANNLGDQVEQMKKIAEEAKSLADKQTNDSMSIADVAKEAKDLSSEAEQCAENTMTKQDQTTSMIDKLASRVKQVEDAHRIANATVFSAISKSKKSLDEATEIHKNASTPLVDIDIQQTVGEAENVKDEAEQLSEEAQKLIDQYLNPDPVTDKKDKARQLLEEAAEKRKDLEDILNEAKKAKEMADAAILDGEKTLEGAKDTLKTLQEFNELIDDSKKDAEKQQNKIPRLRELIDSANKNSEEAEKNLGDAEGVAEEAQTGAEKAQTIAENVKEKATELKERATLLVLPNDTLSDQVADAKSKYDGYKDQAENDKKLAETALDKADVATNDSTQAIAVVEEVLEELRKLLEGLGNKTTPTNVDLSNLDELEARLKNQEDMSDDLDNRITIYEENDVKISRDIIQYRLDLSELKKEMAILKDVYVAMPDTCLKKKEIGEE